MRIARTALLLARICGPRAAALYLAHYARLRTRSRLDELIELLRLVRSRI